MDFKVKIFLIALLLICQPCLADTLTIPTTYATNGSVTAQNLNGNFQAVASKVNGGLDNTNINTTSGYRLFETLSSLPAAGTQGRVVFLTTDSSLNFDTGSAWGKVSTNGIPLPSGSVFFMVSGSCPTGTTDVSSTYSNKFVKINSTQATSSGVILTGTTDSHTLTAAESGLPAHTHTIETNDTTGGGGNFVRNDASSASTGTQTTSSTGGTSAASGHVHTLSSATTLEPSSVTMRACQVL